MYHEIEVKFTPEKLTSVWDVWIRLRWHDHWVHDHLERVGCIRVVLITTVATLIST